MGIGGKALQAADGHRHALDAPHAVLFALVFLGAHPAADGGQGVGLGDLLIRALHIALDDEADKIGDMHLHGTAADAGLMAAAEAPLGLLLGHLPGIALGHLPEIMDALLGRLGGHGMLFRIHIGHGQRTS